MAGGALVFGAVPRLARQKHFRDGLLLGIGVALLACTRPFEGLIVCASAGAALFSALRSAPGGYRKVARIWSKPLIGAAGVVLPALGFIGYYNAKVTGHPLRLPYAVHEAAYGISPLFVWQSPKLEPEYHHPEIESFYRGWGLDAFRSHQSAEGFLNAKLDGTLVLWAFFLGPALTLTLVTLPGLWQDRRLRFAWRSLAALYLGSLCVFWMLPHYFAPAAPLLMLIVVQGVRRLRATAQRELKCGFLVVPAIVLMQTVLLIAGVARQAEAKGTSWAHHRARIAAQLESAPGRHLVFVEYSPNHNVHAEWVYNAASIDDAPIVWARPMGPARDRELLDHFSDRQLWLLDADAPCPQLLPLDRRN